LALSRLLPANNSSVTRSPSQLAMIRDQRLVGFFV
jgi:hypothetical protein